jgi:transcription factor SFP1
VSAPCCLVAAAGSFFGLFGQPYPAHHTRCILGLPLPRETVKWRQIPSSGLQSLFDTSLLVVSCFLFKQDSSLMPDFSDTPPSLHFSPSSSDHDHLSTRESTPVGTPVSSLATNSRKPERDRDLYFSWRRKAAGGSGASAHHPLESTESDDLVPFPLFPSSPPERTMDLDLSPRAAATSPSGQQASNLTSALQRAGEPLGFESTNNWGAAPSAVLRANAARKESFGANMAQWGNGSKPIMMTGSNREKPRRESLAGSLVGGMSWGGVSVGSWIRDEYASSFPFPKQLASYQAIWDGSCLQRYNWLRQISGLI